MINTDETNNNVLSLTGSPTLQNSVTKNNPVYVTDQQIITPSMSVSPKTGSKEQNNNVVTLHKKRRNRKKKK